MAAQKNNFATEKYQMYFTHEAPTKFVFAGVLGFRQRVVPGGQEAIKMCKKAGINVRTISGDNSVACKVIAKEAGIEFDKELELESMDLIDPLTK